MRRLLSTTLLVAACTLTAMADGGQVVTVNGQTTTQQLKKMTFDGDDVILHFADGSTQKVGMVNVSVAFTEVDAIKALEKAADKDAPIEYFNMKGQQLKQAPKHGTFLMKKGDKIVKLLTK